MAKRRETKRKAEEMSKKMQDMQLLEDDESFMLPSSHVSSIASKDPRSKTQVTCVSSQ